MIQEIVFFWNCIESLLKNICNVYKTENIYTISKEFPHIKISGLIFGNKELFYYQEIYEQEQKILKNNSISQIKTENTLFKKKHKNGGNCEQKDDKKTAILVDKKNIDLVD